MSFSPRGPHQSSTPALGHEIPVNLSTNQPGNLSSYSNTSGSDVNSEWGVQSPEIIRPVENLQAHHPQQSSRSKNGLLPPIQLPDNSQPIVDFSENKATFDFITSAKSKIKGHDFTPLTPALPLPCAGSESEDKINLALARHMEACLPGLHEASRELQKIVEAKYEGEFQKPPRPILPMFIPLWKQIKATKCTLGNAAVSNPRVIGTPGNAVASNPRMQHPPNPSVKVADPSSLVRSGVEAWRELKKEVRFFKSLRRARNAEGHWETPADIDGRGLRLWLFQDGSQFYSRRKETELLSLSFYDIRSDTHTGAAVRSELIMHFEAKLPLNGNGGTKLNLYELYAPPVKFPWQHQTNPTRHQTMKRWIVFSISSPIVDFSPSAISAVVSSPDPNTRLSPPNLPVPAPQSWLMFATYFENITAHPVTKEVTGYHTLDLQSTFPHCPPLTSSQQQAVVRYDFDFSQNFAPIFEFSPNFGENDRLVSDLRIEDLRGEFLSARGMRAYNATPTVESPHEAELEIELSRNEWWHEARRGFAADAKAWRRVRDAMARGCCRIVARAAEAAGPAPDLIPGQSAKETRDPPSTDLKRACSTTSQSSKNSVLCRGLERGRGPGEK